MYVINDLLVPQEVRVQDSGSMVPTMLPWFPDAPYEVLQVLGELDSAIYRGEYTGDFEAYLGIRITREPDPA